MNSIVIYMGTGVGIPIDEGDDLKRLFRGLKQNTMDYIEVVPYNDIIKHLVYIASKKVQVFGMEDFRIYLINMDDNKKKGHRPV